jgi:hypothetical protein
MLLLAQSADQTTVLVVPLLPSCHAQIRGLTTVQREPCASMMTWRACCPLMTHQAAFNNSVGALCVFVCDIGNTGPTAGIVHSLHTMYLN